MTPSPHLWTAWTQRSSSAGRPSFLTQGMLLSLTAHGLALAFTVVFLIRSGTFLDPVVPYPPQRDYAAITVPPSPLANEQRTETNELSLTASRLPPSDAPPLEAASSPFERPPRAVGELPAGAGAAVELDELADAPDPARLAYGRPNRAAPREAESQPLSPAGALSRATTGVDSAITPRVLINPAPDYPADALLRRLEGTVLLRVDVDAGGRVALLRILKSSGVASLDEAAREAVRSWRFLPARDSHAALRTVDIPVEFKIQIRTR
jgi:periplasmic protein TonB